MIDFNKCFFFAYSYMKVYCVTNKQIQTNTNTSERLNSKKWMNSSESKKKNCNPFLYGYLCLKIQNENYKK